MKKRVMMLFLAVLTAGVCLGGCGKASDPAKEPATADKNSTIAEADQTGMPKKGETVAIMEVEGFGEISLRFFPGIAPKAVENFVTHAKDGYYDGVTFHRVMQDFMIQGGDPTGTGAGGESIWGKDFEDECSDVLLPIRGALCMANAGADTNGSQFFIVQTSQPNTNTAQGLTSEQTAMFEQYGGTPWLLGAHTVFGQVYEGMDVVDAIAATGVNPNDNRPLENVVITKITVTEYEP